MEQLDEDQFSSLGPNLELKEVFHSYYPRLCYFAYKLVNSKSVAEDLVQDVFLNILGKQYDFKKEQALKAFLYQAVKNASLNALKKKNVKDRYADSIMPISSEEPQVLENLIKSEVYGNLHAALQSLPKGCRKVVRLSYFDGLKNDEISQMLNVSVNTVKTQKKRALQLLRLRLNSFLILFFLLFG
jgi:RNA polymerase sigma-70 factor (ECF subfamily)